MPASSKTKFNGVVVYPREEHLAAGDPLDTAKADILWNNIHALGACNTPVRYNIQASEAVPTADSATAAVQCRLTVRPTTGWAGFPSETNLLQDVPFLLYKAEIRSNLNNDNSQPFALDIKMKLGTSTASGTGTIKVFLHFGNENLVATRAEGTWRPTLTTPPTSTDTLWCSVSETQASSDMTLYRYGTASTVSNVVLPRVQGAANYLERSSHVPGALGNNLTYLRTFISIWAISNKDLVSTTFFYIDGLTIREIPYDGVVSY